MNKVEIILSSPQDSSQRLPLHMQPTESPIAIKWLRELKRSLSTKPTLEKNFCFMGFPKSTRDLNFLCDELNHYIDHLNEFSKKGKWTENYKIPQRLDRSAFNEPVAARKLLNELHHHFELLMGQVWDISPFFQEADNEARFAIRQVNNLTHEMEHVICAMVKAEQDPETVTPSTIVSLFNSPRYELAPEDYKHFTLDRDFGHVYMHYCQAGKTHWEAFIDNDNEIHDENITSLRYYSAEFDIEWGSDYLNGSWFPKKKTEFYHWLGKNGVELNDPGLGLGWLYLGEFPKEQFGDRKLSEIHELIGQHLNILEIRVEVDGEEASCSFGPALNREEQIAKLFN